MGFATGGTATTTGYDSWPVVSVRVDHARGEITVITRLGANSYELVEALDAPLTTVPAARRRRNAEASRIHRPFRIPCRERFRARHGYQQMARLPCYRGVRVR